MTVTCEEWPESEDSEALRGRRNPILIFPKICREKELH